jgi:hypothetical protein
MEQSLDLNPAQAKTRRDLAMALQEVGRLQDARVEIVRCLGLEPQDVWSIVVFANHLMRFDVDYATAETWLRKARAIDPDDIWTMNSLGALCFQTGQTEEGEALFRQVIAHDPTLPNSYLGLARALHGVGKEEEASNVLREQFRTARQVDFRSARIFDESRLQYEECQEELAKRYAREVEHEISNLIAQLEESTGYPVHREERGDVPFAVAKMEAAWTHRKPHHTIVTKADANPLHLGHLVSHELMHLRLQHDARVAGRNRLFMTSAQTREFAIRSMAADIEALQRTGHAEDSIEKFILNLVNGLANFLFNCPLDMLIERRLFQEYPELRPAQYISLQKIARDNWSVNSNPEVRRLTPANVMRASLALNGAYALFLDELLAPVSNLAPAYKDLKTYELSKRIYAEWKERSQDLDPGDEYMLVDRFAELVGLTGWYGWLPDVSDPMDTERKHEEASEPKTDLSRYHDAALWYLLGALKRYKDMSDEEVRNVAFEIAMLGTTGLDYDDLSLPPSIGQFCGLFKR